RRPEDDADKTIVGVLQQQRFAHALVLVVEGQWHERMIFGDVRLVGHAIDRAGRCVDKSLHAGFLCRNDHRFEGIEIDRRAQALVELEACVVGYARKAEHNVLVLQGRVQFGEIPDVSRDDFKSRIVLGEKRITEIEKVVNGDVVSLREELGHQKAAAIPGATGYKNILGHVFPSRLRNDSYAATSATLMEKPAAIASLRNVFTVSKEYSSRSLPTKASLAMMSFVAVMMWQLISSAWKTLRSSRGLAHSNSAFGLDARCARHS